MTKTDGDKKLWEVKNRFFTVFEIPEQQIMWGWFEDNIRNLLSKQKTALKEEFRKVLNSGRKMFQLGVEEERKRWLNQSANEHDQKIKAEPMGVSQWKKYGEQYSYWDFFVLARLPEEKEYDNSGLPFNKAWRGGWNECLAEVRKRLEKS